MPELEDDVLDLNAVVTGLADVSIIKDPGRRVKSVGIKATRKATLPGVEMFTGAARRRSYAGER